MKSARKAHLKLGRRGENAAWKFLESKGCELIARNWRVKAGELDLVVLDGETLVFVEVKTLRRKGVFRPLDNLSMLQIKRNARAAARYWNALGNPDMPFVDVIAGIKVFLLPVWDAIITENEFQNNWLAADKAWDKEKTV